MRGARNHLPIGTRERSHELAAEKASTALPVNVRDLAVYQVSWTIGCAFCVDFGTMLARLEGLDVDRLKEIGNYATSPVYTDDECASIADAMTATHSDTTREAIE